MLSMLKLPVQVTDLGFGDFAFLGQGEGGIPVPVGVERKALKDWIASFYTGRFAGHQLPGLLKSYQVVYVVLEGVWRMDHSTGLVITPQGKKWADLDIGGGKGIMYTELEHQLVTFESKGGVLFRRTGNKMETCKFINALYHWWNDKAWEEHRSHLRFKTLDADKQLLVKPSLCRQVAATLPGVGWVKSGAVATKFKSVYSMVQATEKDWVTIEGIGKPMAQKIMAALKGGVT